MLASGRRLRGTTALGDRRGQPGASAARVAPTVPWNGSPISVAEVRTIAPGEMTTASGR
ncbi:MAG: hypothetical protein ACLQDY_02730 [Streptosporangiaceae bacterium]